VLVYALPYLDPDVVRRELSGDGDADPAPAPLPRSHEAVVGAGRCRRAIRPPASSLRRHGPRVRRRR
jgi:exonuclease SbcD